MGREMVYQKCKYCGGRGTSLGKICPACHGKGIQVMGIFQGDRPSTLTYKKCGNCGGDGVDLGRTCRVCGGSGNIMLDLHVEEY